MKCEVCGQGPAQGTSIHRTTPKGELPHWRCEFHLPAEHRPTGEVAELVAIIENDNRQKH